MVGLTANLLQNELESRKTNSVRIKKGSPIDKKIIFVKMYPRRSISRKIEIFCRSLDENNTGSQNLGLSKRVQTSISFKKFSFKNLFHWEGEELVKVGAKEMLKKETIRKVQQSKEEFTSSLFLVKKG